MKKAMKTFRASPRLVLAAAALAAWSLGGCADSDRAGGDAPESAAQDPAAPSLPDDIFEHVREITLEEDTAVINVYPNVTVDPLDGSFLIADSRENRIRVYDRSGRLMTQFGSAGDGPAEFRRGPSEARRLPDRGIAVTTGGRVLEFDANGTFQLGFAFPLQGRMPMQERLPDGRLLVAAKPFFQDDPVPLLYVWEPVSDTIIRSFFPMPMPGDLTEQEASGWINENNSAFARRADTIAAVAALTDTLFLFTADGDELGRVPLPFRNFRRPESYDMGDVITVEIIQAWESQLHLIEDVFWLDDGSFLIQYRRPRGSEDEWNLLLAGRDGDRIFDLVNTPRLLAVHGDLLYFIDPRHTLAANRWVEVRLRE